MEHLEIFSGFSSSRKIFDEVLNFYGASVALTVYMVTKSGLDFNDFNLRGMSCEGTTP